MSIYHKHRGKHCGPDQTAPAGAVWSESTLFVYEASDILVDDNNIHFVIMQFKGW